MADSISVFLNGSQVTGRPGMTILELAQDNGIDIPTLCFRPELSPIGACRLCVVEVEGSRTLVASCHTPISPNMVIQTHSPKVLATRKVIVELLLASHPDVCIVCDKANICQLRAIATDLGVGLPRFKLAKHYYPVEDESHYIVRDMSKCILCRRCVSACRELKKECLCAVAYRGFDSKIVVDLDQPLDKHACESCSICIDMCPTGALSKPERGERLLEDKKTPFVITGR
ncbi:2Fe-2S iron-sulfur cluster-binding protein [Chloroflexota bacterium]